MNQRPFRLSTSVTAEMLSEFDSHLIRQVYHQEIAGELFDRLAAIAGGIAR
jgi:hypothetical protein